MNAMNRMMLTTLVIAALVVGLLLAYDAWAQTGSPKCWNVANGEAQTTLCDNGYWITTMPDGTQQSGNGIADPNATAKGSSFVIDNAARATGNVIPPETTNGAAPGTWYLYGAPVP